MKEVFFKFPSTPHLEVLGDIDIRGDKVLSSAEKIQFLSHKLIIEEKVDGANLGISFDEHGNIRVQNRGSYLEHPFSGQWKRLSDWLELRTDALFDQLTDRYILFGEWCYARHSVDYDRLPDWYLGFDIYDKEVGRFFSCSRRDRIFRDCAISAAPVLGQGHFTLPALLKALTKSSFSDKPAEGIYLRFDRGDWLAGRAKLVQPSFIQSVGGHWSRSMIKANRLRSAVET